MGTVFLRSNDKSSLVLTLYRISQGAPRMLAPVSPRYSTSRESPVDLLPIETSPATPSKEMMLPDPAPLELKVSPPSQPLYSSSSIRAFDGYTPALNPEPDWGVPVKYGRQWPKREKAINGWPAKAERKVMKNVNNDVNDST